MTRMWHSLFLVWLMVAVAAFPAHAQTPSDSTALAAAIDRLLASPRYSTHIANIYRDLLIPEANNNL